MITCTHFQLSISHIPTPRWKVCQAKILTQGVMKMKHHQHSPRLNLFRTATGHTGQVSDFGVAYHENLLAKYGATSRNDVEDTPDLEVEQVPTSREEKLQVSSHPIKASPKDNVGTRLAPTAK